MGIFRKSRSAGSAGRTKAPKGVACPRCQSRHLGLGYVDRVNCTVLHRCEACGARWRDDLIDLADRELATRARS